MAESNGEPSDAANAVRVTTSGSEAGAGAAMEPHVDDVPASSTTVDERVDACLVDMLYERNLVPAIVGVPYSLALAATWGTLDAALVGWLLLKLASAGARVGLTLSHRKARARLSTVRWERAQVAALAVDGAVWSMLGAVFARHERLIELGVLLVSVVAIAGVASSVLAMHFRGNVAFTGALIVPAAIRQIADADVIGVFSGLAFLLLFALLMHGGRLSADATRELVRLRFEMAALAHERARALEAAARSDAARSRFLAMVSHELRTPLHGILGGLDLVAERASDDESRARLGIVQRAAEHLLSLVNGLLDFSKIAAGHVEVREQGVDLDALLADVVDLCRANAAAGVEVVIVKRGEGPTWILADEPRLRQILLNLLGNAVKFTEAGRVTVERIAGPGDLVVSVSDTGPGIAAADLARIFEPFQQVDDSYARRFSGTGLGLPISRDLARAMGGDLTVQSVPGEGSTFELTLPHRPARPTPKPRPRALPRLSGRALVVDDNPTNLMVARAALEKLGVDVVVANDGASGLALLRDSAPDVVLLDCHMPDMDGFEVVRRIRADEGAAGRPRLPVIAVTASAHAEMRRLCDASGFDDVLAKPFSVTELGRMLASRLVPHEEPPGTGDAPASPQPTSALEGAADAIERLGGDRELYESAVAQFGHDHATSIDLAASWWADGRSADAIRLVHTVKGLAATLGAAGLQRATEDLESAMRAGAPDVAARVAAAERAMAETMASIEAATRPE